MNRPESPAADQSSVDLIRRLADSDENNAAVDGQPESTVAGLRGELETMASDLRSPPPDDDFEDESQCRQALEVIKAIGQEPSVAGDAAAAADGNEKNDVADLGTLGQYELVEKIGEGGMGAVYKARHTKLDKIVAIKVLPSEKMKDKSAVARFEREMRAVGKLEHPNIVRAMDAGEVDGMHFLVMEYVKGLDLSQISKQYGPLPIAEACELIRQAAVGLDEAFDNDMVHRDIKPSNLILAQRRRKPPVVKILDMGLALLSDAHGADAGLTTTGQMMGTLDYMAPEQGGDSKNVDIRADIYALGASLYRLLCGEVIYFGEKYTTPVQKMMALAIAPAPPIQSRQEGIPDQLAAIVHKMLEKEPAARYATPQEIVDDLAPYCAGADLGWLLTGERSDPSADADASLSVTELGASSSEVETDITIDRPSDITQPNVIAGGAQGSASPVTVDAPADPSAVTIAPVIKTDPRAKPRGGTAGSPSSAAAKTLPAALRNIPPKLLIAGGAGLLGIIGLLAAMVFFFQTPNGTLRVEINDPDIEVTVKGSDIVLKQSDKEEITLTPGEHALVVKRGDFSFQTRNFELKKGETTTVKVELLPGKVQVALADGVILGEKATGTPLVTNEQRLPTPGASSEPPVVEGGGYPGKFALHIPERDKAYVEVPTCTASTVNDLRVKTKALTLEAWVKRDRQKMDAHEQYFGIALWQLGSGSGGAYVDGGESGGRGAAALRFRDIYGPAQNQKDASAWTHIAAVKECGKQRRLYVNGQLVGSERDPDDFGNVGGGDWQKPLKLGGSMVGLLGEARVSTVARYDKNFTPQFGFEPDEHTLALYHFDEGSGDVLRDSSGNNHHGKIVGAKWVRVGGETCPIGPRRRDSPSNSPATKARPRSLCRRSSCRSRDR